MFLSLLRNSSVHVGIGKTVFDNNENTRSEGQPFQYVESPISPVTRPVFCPVLPIPPIEHLLFTGGPLPLPGPEPTRSRSRFEPQKPPALFNSARTWEAWRPLRAEEAHRRSSAVRWVLNWPGAVRLSGAATVGFLRCLPEENPDTTCLGLPARTAEKRPGVVDWGSGWGGSPSWQSQTGRVWEMVFVCELQKSVFGR